MKKTDLTIVIITHNSQNQIEGCLKSIANQNIPVNILIIDNCSTDKTWNKLQTLKKPNITLIKNKINSGFAKAVNQGVRFSNRNFKNSQLLLLNPDTELAEDCLKNLIQALKTDSKLGLCSPLIKNSQTKKTIFEKGQINWLRMNTTHNSVPKVSLDYLTGCCLLIKKPVWDKLEGLDERFFLYYEDADLSLRAQKNGFKIKTVKSAICFHQESSSSDSDEKTYQLVKNGLIFFHKHFSLPIRFLYFCPIFWLRLLYHTLISHKKPVLRGMKDFYLNK